MIKTILLDAGGVLYLNNNGMGYVNPPLLDFIKLNKEKYSFGIISTTAYDLEDILKKDGINALFKIILTSGKTGLQKEKTEIYRRALSELGVQPEEVIFIDNEQSCVEAASSLGIKTLFYDGSFDQCKKKIEQLQLNNNRSNLSTTEEQIILVSEKDEPIGTMGKLEAHEKGLLHRAFSIFVRNSEGKFLLQERATTKYHSGGLWTNTVCGHQREGEGTLAAAHRRLGEEMGFDCPLQESFVFHYKASLDHSLTENEIDHVLVGIFDGAPKINPEEADGFAWLTREEIERDLAAHPEKYTYWFKVAMEKAKDGGFF